MIDYETLVNKHKIPALLSSNGDLSLFAREIIIDRKTRTYVPRSYTMYYLYPNKYLITKYSRSKAKLIQ